MARWLLFLYRLPSHPSAPRVAVWRALKRLPGAYLQDGVFAIRHSQLHSMELRNLAHDVRNYGGQAILVETTNIDGEDALSPAPKRAKRPRKGARKGNRLLGPVLTRPGIANGAKPRGRTRRVARL